MKHDETNRKKQGKMMKNREKTMKHDEQEKKTINIMKKREQTLKHDEKERKNNEQ